MRREAVRPAKSAPTIATFGLGLFDRVIGPLGDLKASDR